MIKKSYLLHTGALTLLLAACSTTPQSGKQEGQIDIVPAFENQTELKVSHLGKDIRYVPLETNDSSLIGNSWSIRLLEDKILVSTKEGNLLFDRQKGKFLREVSSVGQGPQEYLPGNYVPFIHPQTGDIYFNRTPEKMIRFNQDGKYLGDLTLPIKWEGECYLTFDNDQVLLHFLGHRQRLYWFGTDAQVTDSIVLPPFGRGIDFQDFKEMAYFVGNGGKMLGMDMFAVNGVKIYGYKSKERQDIEPVHYPSIYRTGDELCFYEAYNDTVFCIEDGKLSPRWIFNTGKYHFPKELHGNVKESLDRIVVTYVTENDHLLFFQCAKGWFAGGKKVELCNAVLNKKDGTLLMNDRKKGFTDDLTNFMPFYPEDFTPKGEYIGALNVWDIQEWLEEHPDVKLEGALAPLKDLADDANPVVVIVRP